MVSQLVSAIPLRLNCCLRILNSFGVQGSNSKFLKTQEIYVSIVIKRKIKDNHPMVGL